MNVFSNQVLNARVTRNITVHQSAVADYCGEGSFNVVVGNSGWSTMYEPPEATTKTQAVRVQVTALDDALKDEKRIDLIKIDAEGAERKIFDGLINILQKNREIKIIMEFGPENLIRAGIDPGEFVDYLSGFGLRIRAIDEALGTTEDISREALLACDSVNVLLWRDIS